MLPEKRRRTRLFLPAAMAGEPITPASRVLATFADGARHVASSETDLRAERYLRDTLGRARVTLCPVADEDACDGATDTALKMVDYGATTACIVMSSLFGRPSARRQRLRDAMVRLGVPPAIAQAVPIVTIADLADPAAVPPLRRQRIVVDRAHWLGSRDHAAWLRFAVRADATSVDLVGCPSMPSLADGWCLAHVARQLGSSMGTLLPDSLDAARAAAARLQAASRGLGKGGAEERSIVVVRDEQSVRFEQMRRRREAQHTTVVALGGLLALADDDAAERGAARDAGAAGGAVSVDTKTLEHFNTDDWLLLLTLTRAWSLTLPENAQALIDKAPGGKRALACPPQ
jgi:hypothetical protein